MSFPLDKYNLTSIYSLNNGYYIDIIANPKTNEYTIVSKTPEGASVADQLTLSQEVNYSNPVLKNGAPPAQVKQSINSEISFLSQYLNVEDLSIIEIIKKQTPPLPKTNISPENGDSDFFKKQSPKSSKKEDNNLNKKSSKSEDIGETDFFKKYSPDKE